MFSNNGKITWFGILLYTIIIMGLYFLVGLLYVVDFFLCLFFGSALKEEEEKHV